jgi:4-hydroxy 2-oxovalerate aldolase
MPEFKILDCTLRDGGYYTNWDFDRDTVDNYIISCNNLPIEYIEIGYRSIPLNGYYGEYFYLPKHVLNRIKSLSTKKLVIILNEKDTRIEHIPQLLEPCVGIIDLVRIALDPKEITRATILAKEIKKMGFEVAFNVMYMSKWKYQPNFLELLPQVDGIVDFFYMVDSYGGVYPNDVKETTNLIREILPNTKLGFHGHNNLELALINTLTAIEEGCSIVDATVTGMGRGAGNIKTELLLTALNAKGTLEVDFNSLSKIVDSFSNLKRHYEWGTNLPYMFSGANSLPQKDVMNWVGKRYFSFNSIIRALQKISIPSVENDQLRKLDNVTKFKSVLLVGGGSSVNLHQDAVLVYLMKNADTAIIHASSKNALVFKNLSNKQYFCLVGNEGYRMEDVFKMELPEDCICILPPSPRKMGTYLPKYFKGDFYELDKYTFKTKLEEDSHTAIALQLAYDLGAVEINCIGYDGYSYSLADMKQQELFAENQMLFSKFMEQSGIKILSLTPTSYELEINSIYKWI